MWLIKVDDLDNLQLSKPFYGTSVPKFAILSHTWHDPEDELCFQDMANLALHRHKSGYKKIRSFCAQAKQHGYHYAWADTVCIDKTNNAELSEAINSMYQWYSISSVCFVILEDLPAKSPPLAFDDLRTCLWFTRGWTLQELLAPRNVIFFNTNWENVGRKSDLVAHIAKITGIDNVTLLGVSARRASIARRMSWASRRKTTRPEDIAYCLLGLFGINMPLLYGEGDRAFIRLQEEILRSSNDHSIFAWSTEASCGATQSGYWGLLAPSPMHFKDSAHYYPIRDGSTGVEHAITNRGISLKVLADRYESTCLLNCRASGSRSVVTLPIARLRTGPNEYARLNDPFPLSVVPFEVAKSISEPIQIFVRSNLHEKTFEEQYMVKYLEIIRFPSPRSGYELMVFSPMSRFDHMTRTIFASPFPRALTGALLGFQHSSTPEQAFVLVFLQDPSSLEGDTPPGKIRVFRPRLPWDGTFLSRIGNQFAAGDAQDSGAVENLLPQDVEIVVRDGIQAWKLRDGTFVRVCVHEDHRQKVDSLAVAEIFVGKSWERDIIQAASTQEEDDLEQGLRRRSTEDSLTGPRWQVL